MPDQVDRNLQFLSRTAEFQVLLTQDAAIISVTGATAACTIGRFSCRSKMSRRSRYITFLVILLNYLIGNDPTHWKTGIPRYRRVRYPSVYRGIDMEYSGDGGILEFRLFR